MLSGGLRVCAAARCSGLTAAVSTRTCATRAACVYDPLPKLHSSSDYERLNANWAETVQYQHSALVAADDVLDVQEAVASASLVRPVGSAHSFNHLSDAPGGTLLSVAGMRSVLDLDVDAMTVDVEPGVTYGVLCEYLQQRGAALPMVPSLPQPTVVGAVATGTHGTGVNVGSMASQVLELDVVAADGAVRTFTRGSPDFDLACVNLGALGVVTRMRLSIEPTYDVAQWFVQGVSLDTWLSSVDDWAHSCFAPSAFVNFGAGCVDLWQRSVLPLSEADGGEPGELDAVLSAAGTPPTFGGTVQPGGHVGVPFFESGAMVPGTWHGAWSDVLFFFRKNGRDVPMPNCAIHTEYFVPLKHAQSALSAVADATKSWPGWSSWDEDTLDAATAVGPLICETRLMQGDETLALSPCAGAEPFVSIHFTLPRAPGTALALDQVQQIEAALAPFKPRPHWGKMFTMTAEQLRANFPEGAVDRFVALQRDMDPTGKFLNPFLRHHLGV